ncbi:hypothetical protein [Planctomycetes bacterium K23_9]|uniref:Uncharacterized protein n=1 Tax=Stieleria marina TaxID=1930275 RepID=A0A517NQT3_9BACT|nr:hypothetical protein K239x_14270 [Planctomycetes bacterium K23_9]
MSPKHKLITTVWCSITMVATMVLSHGHLILREVMTHWPEQESWEGRFETALYTQGGLVFVASFVVGGALLIRSYFTRMSDEELKRKELAQREKHERATATRHEALMGTLANSVNAKASVVGSDQRSASKKSHASGARPR